MLRKLCVHVLLSALACGTAFAAAQQDFEAAAKAGQTSFVLVYDQAALQIDQARQLISDVMSRVPGSVKIEVDRNEPANADFVAKYRLSAAPVPLILITSRTGVVTGGIVAQQATADQLVKMVPSPKKSEIVKALSEGNAVLITACRKDMATVETVTSACAAACQQMAGKSIHIKINMDDPAETDFLAELKVNTASTEPVTLVANAQGQIAGMYTGDVQVANLVTAATKKVGGCCPKTVANPNASCAPTPKK
jgi:hypothetical protein